MECRSVGQCLGFAASQADTSFDTPNLANFWKSFALEAVARQDNDLLGRFNLIALKQPRGRALDNSASIALGNLLKEAADLALGVLLLARGSLFLIVGGCKQPGWHHQAQDELIGIVCCEQQIGIALGDVGFLAILARDNEGVADNGTESVNLSAQLDFCDLSLLEGRCGLFGIGLERSVRRDVGARGDGGRVGLALGNLLALVDLGDFLFDELVALFAQLDDVCAFNAPFCRRLVVFQTRCSPWRGC
jgi:hypothetical protein